MSADQPDFSQYVQAGDAVIAGVPVGGSVPEGCDMARRMRTLGELREVLSESKVAAYESLDAWAASIPDVEPEPYALASGAELRWLQIEADNWVSDCNRYSVLEIDVDEWAPMFAPLGNEDRATYLSTSGTPCESPVPMDLGAAQRVCAEHLRNLAGV